MPSSFGSKPSARPDELGKVQHRQAEVAVDDLRGVGLLEVEVQVAERAGRHERVRLGVDRVADVAAGLRQRGLRGSS